MSCKLAFYLSFLFSEDIVQQSNIFLLKKQFFKNCYYLSQRLKSCNTQCQSRQTACAGCKGSLHDIFQASEVIWELEDGRQLSTKLKLLYQKMFLNIKIETNYHLTRDQTGIYTLIYATQFLKKLNAITKNVNLPSVLHIELFC